MEELKTRSFRITEETAERIKELAGEIGGNQQEVMAKLIEAYEFQKGKAVLTDKKGEIEKFEQHTAILTRMFMASLEDNQNVTATVRVEFESQLNSKDLTISTLQEENKSLKQAKTEAAAQMKTIQEENEALQRELDAASLEAEEKKNTFDSTVKDKEELNQALTVTINELKSKIEGMEQTLSEAREIKKNYRELENSLHIAETSVKETEKRLENGLQKAELDTERKMFALDKAHQEEIQKIKSENQREIDQYQKKYLELLEKLQEKGETKTPARKPRAQTKKTVANPEQNETSK